MGLLNVRASEAEEERVALGCAGPCALFSGPHRSTQRDAHVQTPVGWGSIHPRLQRARREETALVNTQNITVLSPGVA